MDPVWLADPEKRPAPGSVSAGRTLVMCGEAGAVYGALFGSLIGLIAVLGYERLFLSLGVDLLKGFDLAGMAMASASFAACGAVAGLPSGFLGGMVYGAFGSRAGAFLGGLLAALASPFGFSYLLEMGTGAGSAGRSLPAELLGWAPFVFAPLLALGLHAAMSRGRAYYLLPVTRLTLEGSVLAAWPPARRAAFAATVAVGGTATLVGVWTFLLRA